MKIVGIVNITRDSFSDGGRYLDPAAALGHAERLFSDGADIVELGAQSTHPDAELMTAAEEIERLEPVLTPLASRGVTISVDTARPEVMRFAVERGARMINDVTGFRDSLAIDAVRDSTAKIVVMHAIRTAPDASGDVPCAERVELEGKRAIDAALEFLGRRVQVLLDAGVARNRIVLDPGMGFFLSTAAAASLLMLREMPRVRALGFPVMISVSRKSFIGAALGRGGAPLGVERRGAGTLAAELWAYSNGADYIRTHDVRALRDAATLWEAIRGSSA